MTTPIARCGLGMLTALLLSGLAGCTHHHRTCVPSELNRPGALIPLVQTSDNPEPIDPELFKSLASRQPLVQGPKDAPTRPIKALVLSGGSMYGAYAVGVLGGWTASGTRPCFDVVTGISTGGLIATYAFLGPQYDQRLLELYTTVTTHDIYRKRSVVALLWADAATSSKPLERLIEKDVNDELLQAVASAHVAGRRLYVGTTNLDTGRLVVWDMGAIAASGRPDAKALYRKILLATSSIPGLMPPVELTVDINGRQFTELHVDGGATTALFLRAADLNPDKEALRAGRPCLAGAEVYVIVSGKLYSDPECTQRRAIKMGHRSLDTLVVSQTRAALFQIYAFCGLGGARFHLAAIPEDHYIGAESIKFEPPVMRRLYDAGYQLAVNGKAWQDAPPLVDKADHPLPRSGNEFIAPSMAVKDCCPVPEKQLTSP